MKRTELSQDEFMERVANGAIIIGVGELVGPYTKFCTYFLSTGETYTLKTESFRMPIIPAASWLGY